ncbi:hypothetical protein RD110_14955 [Rhodoferax koreense]|uniref:Uncharacterized protein n=1 Tax=Rhodoferax koreensis TaxID=1842727 RepID=A0A1P8JX44_9BURK|nr:hypothetical protein [Rhodoferax koreense]APW38329.1 hypothetical protein RD110_14955 [Rhodoferax koreense]
MLPTRITLALVVAFSTMLAARADVSSVPPVPSSPLDSFPARIDYVSNNAPFVVFDIAPRTLHAPSAVKSFKELTLSFVATDALHRVDVHPYVISKQGAVQEVANRIACGSTIAGHHDCAIPAREALLLLKGGDGQFGLRIEAEGIEGERSTVRITLPVQAGISKPAPARVASPLPLTLLSHITPGASR